VPSTSTIPGYTAQESGVGRLGLGVTHGRPVSPHAMSRRHPSIGTTSSAQPIPFVSLSQRASSPTVIPCRSGIRWSPTNDSNPGRSIGPSTATPPTGFGRSSTTKGTPASAHASIASAIVHTKV